MPSKSKQLNLVWSDNFVLDITAVKAGDDSQKNRRFTMSAYSGGLMRVSGWSSPVCVDLKGMTITQQSKPIFFGHEQSLDSLIGQTDKITIKSGALSAEGDVIGVSEKCRQVIALHDAGYKWQASIGARAEEIEVLAENEKAKVNGQEIQGPACIVRRSVLGEISFVMLGADESTSASITAQAEIDNLLIDKEANMPEVENKVEAKTSQPTPDTAEITARYAAEHKRISEIESIEGISHEIAAKAIAEKWTVDATKLAVIQANTPKAPAVKTEQRLNASVIEVAALLSAKADEKMILKAYGEQTTNEAGKYHKIGIIDLFRLAAKSEGIELPLMMSDKNTFIRAAFSTVSLPNILSNIANKLLLDAYLNQENSWRKIVKIASVNDFKTHSRFRLTDNLTFVKVGADGELKHGKLSEQVYTQKADTSGIMFSLNRQTIINDDLDAFADIPKMLGIGAADAISDAIWGLILSNPNAMYSLAPAGYKANYAEGADTALSIAGLTAADLMFRNQQKPNGKPLGIAPKYLVVPNALTVTAKLLMTSLKVNESSNVPNPEDNPWAGAFEVVTSSWLGNSTIAGNSAKAWYLFADPNRLASFEIAFLNGNENPTIESADADFNTLGIQFRGYIDFGVAPQDPRASVKMKGEA
ncbi:MAG: hypothetical protein A2Y12_01330 [Planctomycetes bacterium GWF2_42_9]|nr:MAG: hypothetical protein A2Y12_01330 [Planctomycetes bacterium GWF2_42_9]